MRGTPDRQLSMLSSLSTEDLIPADHPIRRTRVVVDTVLTDLDGVLAAMYPPTGRPSVRPEMLLKASVLRAMYSMRSERAFCERLNDDMLFTWFLDLPIDAASFDASTFSKNRRRLLDADVADEFFAAVVRQGEPAPLHVVGPHSLSTAPCWRCGRHTSRSSPKATRATMVTARRAAAQRSNGAARNDPTTSTRRRPTPTPGSFASRTTPPPSSALPDTSSSSTAPR